MNKQEKILTSLTRNQRRKDCLTPLFLDYTKICEQSAMHPIPCNNAQISNIWLWNFWITTLISSFKLLGSCVTFTVLLWSKPGQWAYFPSGDTISSKAWGTRRGKCPIFFARQDNMITNSTSNAPKKFNLSHTMIHNLWLKVLNKIEYSASLIHFPCFESSTFETQEGLLPPPP